MQQFNNVPQHVAIIMDGNRRWAKEHGLPVFAGHRRVTDEKGVCIKLIGDINGFPKDLKGMLEKVVKQTQNNKTITVIFALNYGGRDELLRAVRKLVKEISSSQLADQISNLTEQSFAQFLDTSGIPDPDIIIRAGGEKRLSNFLIWEAAYSELFFSDTLWPALTKEEFDSILKEYAVRERRFGK